MKTIIAGSRTITDDSLVESIIDESGVDITKIVCGCASGVDTLGARFAEERKIPIEYFPADWRVFGKRAGILRNQQMAENADALILIWDGESRGSSNMLMEATKRKLKVYNHIVTA